MKHMDSITDEEREEMRETYSDIPGISEEELEDLLNPQRSPLPLDSGLEVVITPTPGDAFDESHYHFTPEEMVLHLNAGDAHDFERMFADYFLLPMIYEAMQGGPDFREMSFEDFVDEMLDHVEQFDNFPDEDDDKGPMGPWGGMM
jgi:hypothetical protein